MELLEKVKSMTNDSGRAMFRWDDYDVIGIEMREDSNWFYPIVKFKGSEGVYVLSLPYRDSDCKATIFSHLWYYALLVAQELAGIRVVWNKNSWPTWPTWICRDEDLLKAFFRHYNDILARYGFTDTTIQQNYIATRRSS